MLENSAETPRGNIVACVDVVNGVRYEPQTLGDIGLERITGRSVTEWSASLGSYGMGGPGFFGLRLSAKADYPDEWLVLRVWGAANWLLLDGHWVEAHPNQYHVQEPLYSNFGPGEEWDRVSEKLLGTTLQRASVEQDSSAFYLAGTEDHKLEIPQDTSVLSLSGGTMQPRVWSPNESQLDAWIIAHGDLWV